jgi:hypothetical protein
VTEVRPLLAARGFAVPERPGLRMRTKGIAEQFRLHPGVKAEVGARPTGRLLIIHQPNRRASMPTPQWWERS